MTSTSSSAFREGRWHLVEGESLSRKSFSPFLRSLFINDFTNMSPLNFLVILKKLFSYVLATNPYQFTFFFSFFFFFSFPRPVTYLIERLAISSWVCLGTFFRMVYYLSRFMTFYPVPFEIHDCSIPVFF